MIEPVAPIEEVDPEFASLIMDVCHKRLPAYVWMHRVFETKSYDRTLPARSRIKREIIIDVGRNGPCICGSGRKFKKCCGGYDR